jgi:purine-nucleoside phosphorylase
MSLHINAGPGDLAPVVLMPGDPLRAKFMAEKFLENLSQVANTRNVLYFTGDYRGQRISIGASGMGCPSIGIYSYELYSFHNVKAIVRIGTAGAYSTDNDVFDLINCSKTFSESSFARDAFGFSENFQQAHGDCYDCIQKTAGEMNLTVLSPNVHSSDVFYRAAPGIPPIAAENDCKVVEMEAFALFATARHLNRMAGTLLTVSDVIPTGKDMSAKERETALLPMMELALESGIRLKV